MIAYITLGVAGLSLCVTVTILLLVLLRNRPLELEEKTLDQEEEVEEKLDERALATKRASYLKKHELLAQHYEYEMTGEIRGG